MAKWISWRQNEKTFRRDFMPNFFRFRMLGGGWREGKGNSLICSETWSEKKFMKLSQYLRQKL
jgi:hypothetical protein